MMAMQPAGAIHSYHAHIYFKDEAERETASVLRHEIARRFLVQLGRWREEPVGPHHLPMYQVAFAIELFGRFVPWLALNRTGLTVLIHPNTSNARKDHLIHAIWMGCVLPILRPEQLPEAMEVDEPVIPNTQPDLPDEDGPALRNDSFL